MTRPKLDFSASLCYTGCVVRMVGITSESEVPTTSLTAKRLKNKSSPVLIGSRILINFKVDYVNRLNCSKVQIYQGAQMYSRYIYSGVDSRNYVGTSCRTSPTKVSNVPQAQTL